jgi:hypothetical protein
MPEPLHRIRLKMINSCPALRSSLSGYRKPITIVPSAILIPCYHRPKARAIREAKRTAKKGRQTAAKVDQKAPRHPAAGSLTPFPLSSAAASAAIVFHSMPEPPHRNPLTMIKSCPALRSSLSGNRKPITIAPSAILIPCYHRPRAPAHCCGRVATRLSLFPALPLQQRSIFHSMPKSLHRNQLTMSYSCLAVRSSLSDYHKPLTIVPSAILIPCYHRPRAGAQSCGRAANAFRSFQRCRFSSDQSFIRCPNRCIVTRLR